MKLLSEIIFDKDDQSLFTIEDLQLKADAIRNSILPRLELLTNHFIAQITEIYKFDFTEDNSIIRSPQFRKTNRIGEIKLDYNYALCGISGKRQKNKWVGLKKKPNNIAEIVPFRLEFILDRDGIRIGLHNTYLKNWTKESIDKFIEFTIEKIDLIQMILFRAEVQPAIYINEDINYIETFKDLLIKYQKFNWSDIIYNGKILEYPIKEEKINGIIESAIILYPIYDAYIKISQGKADTFEINLESLNRYYLNKVNNENPVEIKETKSEDYELAIKAAELKIRVMPAIRWQVFQRDNWKCLSCGKTAQDGIILHVDHILPRSKGGQDVLTNYQTLCHICNIGKSNKDQTDLRNRNEIE